MIRPMPAEARIAVAIADLPDTERWTLERAARSGNWVGKRNVVTQSPEEMVLDAIVGAFRVWCQAPYSVPFSVREIFERIYGEAADRPHRRFAPRSY